MSRTPVAPRPERLPRRPFGRPEALKALATVALLAGFVAFAMPPLYRVPQDVERVRIVPALPELPRFLAAGLGFLTGALLLWLAVEDGRLITRGLRGPGSAPAARRVVVVCGLAVGVLIPAYYTLKRGRQPTSVDEHLVTLVLVAVSIFLLLVGGETRVKVPGFRNRVRPPPPDHGPYVDEEAPTARGADLSGWQEAVGPRADPPPGQPRLYGIANPVRSRMPGPQAITQRVGPVSPQAVELSTFESLAILGAAFFTLVPLAILLLSWLGLLR